MKEMWIGLNDKASRLSNSATGGGEGSGSAVTVLLLTAAAGSHTKCLLNLRKYRPLASQGENCEPKYKTREQDMPHGPGEPRRELQKMGSKLSSLCGSPI